MTDEVQVVEEATPEVVQTEVEQTEAPEAVESTEGQTDDQPAEGEKPEDEISPSKARRERRKAELDRLRQSEAEATAKLQEYEQRRAKIEQAASANQPPKENDFADYNDYLMAAGAYHAARTWDSRQASEAQEQVSAQKQQVEAIQKQQQQEIAQNWAAQVEEAKGKYTDFEQVAYSAPISDDVAQMIAASDSGADVAYYLGTHRQEAEHISRLPPLEKARALGAIEARLSFAPPVTQTAAPEPITPIKGKATAAKDPAKMSMAEYMAARKAGKI